MFSGRFSKNLPFKAARLLHGQLFCFVLFLVSFVFFFYFLCWTELPIPTFDYIFSVFVPQSTGYIRLSVFFSGMHNAIATASVFLERFFTSPLSSHDVMSKLFWVENKVMLEKCSVCKQPNRIGNSTELSKGDEFLPRECDCTTTC